MVSKTLGTGEVIEHPAPGTNPHLQGDQSGTTGIVGPPMFQELLHRDATKLGGSLPPGHPVVGSPSKPSNEKPH